MIMRGIRELGPGAHGRRLVYDPVRTPLYAAFKPGTVNNKMRQWDVVMPTVQSLWF